MSYDPIKSIKTCNDIAFLEEMLNKYIPMDYANLTVENNELYAKMFGKDVNEVIKTKRKGIDKIKSIVIKRLNYLKNK